MKANVVDEAKPVKVKSYVTFVLPEEPFVWSVFVAIKLPSLKNFNVLATRVSPVALTTTCDVVLDTSDKVKATGV